MLPERRRDGALTHEAPRTGTISRWRYYFAAAILTLSGETRAEGGDDPDEDSPRSIEREAVEPGDAARDVIDVLLFPPRQAAHLLFTTTGLVGGLIEDEQVVPRVHALWSPREGEINAFPTVFLETGQSFNVGGRVIARARRLASSIRAGYGGSDELAAESKVTLAVDAFVPLVLTGEAFHQRRINFYRGVGQTPETDPRNRFNPDGTERIAEYIETRERFIASVGGRVLEDTEVFLSSSLRWYRTEGPPEGAAGLDDVFVPGTVPGSQETVQLVYTEVTTRFDTREQRGSPSRGTLFELYGGHSRGLYGTNTQFARMGGRAAAFFPIVKSSNILSPKLVLDALESIGGDTVPFTELTRQPDFRGFDDRRDDLSLVASLDYRWAVWKFLAARLFFDVARVAPKWAELASTRLRWAGGFGFDLFSRYSPLGNVALSAGPEGARLVLHVGVAPAFGDRQHW